MKQVVQDIRQGHVRVEEVPFPSLKSGGVLVRTVASIVSPGTERLLLQFGEKSLLGKARERPDLVRQVVEKVRREGVVSTYQAVMGRLTTPLSLGYSSAGVVEAVGEGADGFRVGDRVACAGAGYASHAEVVWVPKNLCALLPEGVTFEEGAFGTIGAIALQGLRLAEPTLGESIVVIGLGLIGQMALQCFKASGCRVLGIDREEGRVTLARELGADEAVISTNPSIIEIVRAFCQGGGADAVVITAATESNEPVELAGEICRDRGRVVIVGAVKIEVPRRTYYEKELDLRLSRSYGPGRYDPVYEEKGYDYPIGYVRWTENRNMQVFLDLVAQDKVNVGRLITHRFGITEAEKAYNLLSSGDTKTSMGILLNYPDRPDVKSKTFVASSSQAAFSRQDRVNVGLIGGGNFARSTLLPILKKLSSVSLKGIATATGVNAKSVGTQYGFDYCTTDYHEIFQDQKINAVVIATRHQLHALLIVEALKAGKHVFVEKPLCITEEQLRQIIGSYARTPTPPLLMVGFNRRFAPHTEKARKFFNGRRNPLVVSYRVNAASFPSDHWINDPEEGGGRIVGEVCHFVDLMGYLIGRRPVRVLAQGASPNTVSITLKYEDDSIGTVHYLASGHRAFSKERVEIFGEGKVFVIDDFKRAEWVSDRDSGTMKSWFRQDKGHRAEVKAFVDAVLEGRPSPVDPNEAFQTTHVTFKIVESLSRGVPVEVP